MMTSPIAALSAQELTLEAADGTPLEARYWPRPQPRGVLVVAHGLGEHGACYAPLAEALGPATEMDVLAFDFRGHGRSPGRRGLVRRYEELDADLQGALRWAEAASTAHLPRFLMGHSNGGLVALRVIQKGQGGNLRGLILSNPALRLAQKVAWPKRFAADVLRRCAPGITLATDVRAEQMTRDPEMVAERNADPLRHTRISAAIYFGMIEGGAQVIRRAHAIHLPTLLILGGADNVIAPSGSQELFDHLGLSDKTMHVYPGMLHEPLNELGRDQVMSDLGTWLAERLPVNAP